MSEMVSMITFSKETIQQYQQRLLTEAKTYFSQEPVETKAEQQEIQDIQKLKCNWMIKVLYVGWMCM